MSEQAVLWLLGTLIAALYGLLGLIWRVVWARLNAIDSNALSQFVARDNEREKAWWEWRRGLDEDRRFRHDELTKRLDAHAEEIRDHSSRITRLERNGH